MLMIMCMCMTEAVEHHQARSRRRVHDHDPVHVHAPPTHKYMRMCMCTCMCGRRGRVGEREGACDADDAWLGPLQGFLGPVCLSKDDMEEARKSRQKMVSLNDKKHNKQRPRSEEAQS